MFALASESSSARMLTTRSARSVAPRLLNLLLELASAILFGGIVLTLSLVVGLRSKGPDHKVVRTRREARASAVCGGLAPSFIGHDLRQSCLSLPLRRKGRYAASNGQLFDSLCEKV